MGGRLDPREHCFSVEASPVCTRLAVIMRFECLIEYCLLWSARNEQTFDLVIAWVSRASSRFFLLGRPTALGWITFRRVASLLSRNHTKCYLRGGHVAVEAKWILIVKVEALFAGKFCKVWLWKNLASIWLCSSYPFNFYSLSSLYFHLQVINNKKINCILLTNIISQKTRSIMRGQIRPSQQTYELIQKSSVNQNH